MKSSLAVFALGLVALIVQGALARTLPPPWCPDFAWLVVVGIGLRWPHFISGCLLAVALGYSMDLVSGSLMGQHASLRLVTFLAAAVGARQLDLSGGLPVGVFVFAMTFVYGFATLATLSFFAGTQGLGTALFGPTFAHALVNVLAAGLMISLVERVLMRFSEDEVGRHGPTPLGFERRGFDRGGLA